MHAQTSENAMTEIALALAMGFFSIMVLTLISMGVEEAPSAEAPALELIENTPAGAGTVTVETDDLLVVFDGDQFLDAALNPLVPENLKPGGRVILAVAPQAPLGAVMAARGRIEADDLVVTNLDASWLRNLETLRRNER